MSKQNKLIIWLVLVGVVVMSFHLIRYMSKEGPRKHTAGLEAEVGESMAEVIRKQYPDSKQITMLVLFKQGISPYQSRIENMQDELQMNVVYAIEDGVYNDDDYSAAIDHALNTQPETDLLIIHSQGMVTHADITSRLSRFIDKGGKLVLIGSARQNSSFISLVEQGKALLIARRTGWLKEQKSKP